MLPATTESRLKWNHLERPITPSPSVDSRFKKIVSTELPTASSLLPTKRTQKHPAALPPQPHNQGQREENAITIIILKYIFDKVCSQHTGNNGFQAEHRVPQTLFGNKKLTKFESFYANIWLCDVNYLFNCNTQLLLKFRRHFG